MAFFTTITVHMFHWILGLAMPTRKVLSSVQVDPKSFRHATSVHVHNASKRVCHASARAAQRGNGGALASGQGGKWRHHRR